MVFLEDVGKDVFKKYFVAAAEQEKLAQILLAPRTGRGIIPLAFLIEEGLLIRAGVGRKERRGPVVLMDGDVAESEPGKISGQQITEAVIAAAGNQPPAMLPQPEFKAAHERLHRIVPGERGEGHIVPKVVRLNTHEESARAQDAEHFAYRIQRLRKAHEHGLAGDDVEAVVGKRQLGGVALV